ncbi:methionine biosynthesis PLP-dependent protein [Halobacillus sp. ACCC02827]|uniref:methionine biosynthesis PLP-dependent protein n=1 Tax=Bacillaceae TaxID=186817 RepID=UPI0004114B73|nr:MULTISPECIES: methionine biosynthesis PLP-dependent protein [Bacillaceae]QHT45260.1 methionine biosynthesis PLP-dependent protein [Bacillus sp. SB49]WJE16040.1 methionine biosynthesis PLP-dependent protein [Halobacillus sp. ACCC02827]
MCPHTDTKFVQTGNQKEEPTGAINPPVYFSTAYRHPGLGESTGFDYTRTGNPTRQALEKSIADIEGGEAGFAFSSGMAAIQTALSLFKQGDEIIVSEDLYGGTYRLFEHMKERYGLNFHYCDSKELDNLTAYINDQTKAIYIETPTNPLMHTTDIREVSKLAKAHDLLLLVDNTLYTPVLQKPLEEGADVVIHSATKYLAGHNDVLAGILVSKGKQVNETLEFHQNTSGAVLSPLDSWLLMRGMKTLPLRMRQHETNAKAVVDYLKEHPAVTDVFYPGRGGMISFRLQHEQWIDPFLRSLNLICFAESLGGVESFITYPATQTHADIPEEIRTGYGVCNRLLRFSVGIEHIDDLLEDLEQTLSSLLKEEIVQ